MNITEKLMEKYPEHIIEYVRQRLGLEKDDVSMDEEILNMSKSEVFKGVVNWRGLVGYEDTLKGWVLDIYGVDLDLITE